ncbi:MAG: PAS domain S-box protein, partial [Rhodoferax sp.]|nr:PAS domain S-box protein [Rhodoferax sp.]
MSGPTRANTQRSRLSSTAATVAGGFLILATLVAVIAFGRNEYLGQVRSELTRSELQARVLEDHATRSVESVSVLLTYLGGQLDAADLAGGHAKADALLAQSLAALPHLRSISVIDGDGAVLASSIPSEAGQRISLARLGGVPPAGKERLGGFIPGRSIAALSEAPAREPARAGVGFIPLVRAQEHQPLYIVALINPDSVASYQLRTLDNPGKSAYLLSYQGQVLAVTGPGTAVPGTSLATHPVYRDYLPATEHASYVGQGSMAERQLVAFRLSRTRPLLVVVEQAHAAIVQRWLQDMRWFALVAALVIVFLAGMTALAKRSLRARESALDALDIARLDVVRREQELRVLVRSLQELVFRTDLQGVLSYANERWVALRGESLAQVLNQPLAQLVEPDDRAAIAALFQRDSGAGVRTATARMRADSGKQYRFDFAVVPLMNGDNVVGFAGSAVDVTERFAAEQALQHQLGFVAQLLESSPLPVATFDATGRYMTVNRAWEEFMGRSRELVVGMRGASFMTTADAALHAERDAELWRTGGQLSYEARVRHRDGTRRDVVVTKVVVSGGEKSEARLLSTMMDVSEFREAERATRQARDAAEEASRAKSEFIANISHELRTPLQSILGFSELGIMRGTQHPKLHAMFTDIHGSGTRMLALVNDLLDVSKIESAVGAVTLERADLRGVVVSVVRELAPLLAARHLHLAPELGAQALVAKVDPVRFAQVVRNVLANAIKFAPMGTSIELQGRVTDDERIHITVRDHGAGIPPGELEKIFEAFVQSSTSKDGSGGTGLGLAICRKILAAHDGTITAANMPDGGAVFTIDLPAR